MRTRNTRVRFCLAIALAAGALPFTSACSGSRAEEAPVDQAGTLRLGLSADLDGVNYRLSATFMITGPETIQLDSNPDDSTLARELGAGDYSIQLQSGFQVLRDSDGSMNPVTAELLSDVDQSFTIASNQTTRVTYRFAVGDGTIEFGPGDLEVGFEVEPRDGEAASCSDGLQDQGEEGVDCGGPCTLTCSEATLDFVSPYVGIAGRPGTLIARGSGLDTGGPTLTALIGRSAVENLVPVGGTELRIDYPALPAGRYPVRIEGASVQPNDPELVVLDPPTMPRATISVSGVRSRLLYDAERQSLYAVNRNDQQLERYRFDGSSWSVLAPVVIPELTDASLTPDGRALVVATQNALGELPLDADAPSVSNFVANPDSFCGGYFDELSMGNDGKALVIFDLAQCSGFSQSYLYDTTEHSLTENPYPAAYFYNGTAAASADGRWVFAGSNGISPAEAVTRFDTLDWSISNAPVSFNLSAVSVSADASRVILQDTKVYDRDFGLSGVVPPGGAAVASPDSNTAVVFRDGTEPEVDVYDLNGDLEPGAVFPLQGSVALDSAPSGEPGNLATIRLAVTPDDRTVFVSGDRTIEVVPLP